MRAKIETLAKGAISKATLVQTEASKLNREREDLMRRLQEAKMMGRRARNESERIEGARRSLSLRNQATLPQITENPY